MSNFNLPPGVGVHDIPGNEKPARKLSDADLDNILKLLDEREKVAALSDRDPSALVLHGVWATLELGSQRETLLDEYITRFETKCGIERDEEGDMLPPAGTTP